MRVEEWVEPSSTKPIDFPEVARQATARVFARGDAEAGYGNIVLALIEAKIVDHADSPYAGAVGALKAMVRGIENNDIKSIRAMASRLHDSLVGALPAVDERPLTASTSSVDVVESSDPNLYSELQTVEDLLTGNESERREGLDRLHQLVRRLRPRERSE